MDAQDIRNLQEAYMEVVINEGKVNIDDKLSSGKTPRQKMKTKASNLDMDANIAGGVASSPSWRTSRAIRLGAKEQESSLKKRAKKIREVERTQKEEVDIYDIILSHLLDEGYADTEESATAIMANMSEDWREGIVEASAAAQRGLPEPHRLMKSANARVAGEKRKTHLGRISLEKKASSHRERQTPEAQAATKDSAARLERINRINARPRTTKEKGLFGAITKSGRLGS